MEIDQVEAFLAILRQGGFTRASSALHLSQPAISRRVLLLEHELGAPLFDRIRGGVVLTEAGRAFLPYAEALLAATQDGVEAVRALRGAGRGAVTLALVGTLANTKLTSRLRRFRQMHPAVDLRLRTALSTEVSALVRRGEATLGLRYGRVSDPDLSSFVVYEEAMVPVCSPRHRLASARRLEPSALAGERWIAFPSGPPAAREPYVSTLEQQLAAFGLGSPEVILIDSLTAQKRMVEADFGLALVPESGIQEELRAGTLRQLRIPAMRMATPVILVHRRRAFLSGSTRALMELLQSRPRSSSGRSRHLAEPPHVNE